VVKLEELIESAKAESSLLMSYCASLPFFEQNILDHLQRAGAGRVTILLDEEDYHASLSDFVTSAGIRYRIQPIRLAHPNANFHPKLYFLVTPTTARLLVASANLTPSGFRSNLEVVDQLSLSDAERSDARAFAQYGEMLRSIVKLDSQLPPAVVQILEKSAADILKRVGDVGNDRGPQFLHSIDKPLLSQLAAIVKPPTIDEIAVISPFFDGKSAAILELAKMYPNAKIRIIKGKSPDSLNGEALIALARRITVEEVVSFGDERLERKLHAKMLILSGKGHEWLVSGSANLTRPAWLEAAASRHCGNVEAVILREAEKGTFRKLLESVKTQRVDHSQLQFVSDLTDLRFAKNELVIVDAQLDSHQITAVVEGCNDLLRNGSTVRMFVEQGGRRTEYRPTLRIDGTEQSALRADVSKRQMKIDLPVLLTVEIVPKQGEVLAARVWVSVPLALAFNSVQRSVRSSMRDVCRRVFIQEDAASVVAEAIGRFLADLGDVVGSESHSAATTAKREEPDKILSVDDFIVSERALGGVHASAARVVQALSGLAAFLQKLLLVGEGVEDELTPADVNVDAESEATSEDADHDEAGQARQPLARLPKKAEALLEELTFAFQSTVIDALEQPVSPVAVPYVLNIPDATVAFVLLHERVRQRLQLISGHEVAYSIREVLQNILSIDGALIGGRYGWLIRAMASDESCFAVKDLLADSIRLNQLRAFVGAGLALDGPIREDDTVAQAVLAGLHLVTGAPPGAAIDDELRAQLDRVSRASVGAIKVLDMERGLRSYNPWSLDLLRTIRRWSLVIKLDAAKRNSEEEKVLSDRLLESAPQLCDQYMRLRAGNSSRLARAVETEAGISCSVCHMVLPANVASQLRSTSEVGVMCPFRPHLIVPLRIEDATTGVVLSWFEGVEPLLK
jgi:hypothetical protein